MKLITKMATNTTSNRSLVNSDQFDMYKSLKNSRGIKIMFCNVFGFLCHKQNIEELIFATEPDILGLAELNLRSDNYEELELAINGYSYEIVQQPREGDHSRGGVAIYYKTGLSVKLIGKFAKHEVEFITLQITRGVMKPITVSTIYRKPQVSRQHTELAINQLISYGVEQIIIGDFNRHPSDGMLDLLTTNFNQLISENTRVNNYSQTLIDHIYISSCYNVSRSGLLDIPIADHSVIYCEVTSRERHKSFSEVIKIRRWKSFTDSRFEEELSKLDLIICSDENISSFIEHVNSCLDICAPTSRKLIKRIREHEWISSEIKSLARTRNKIWRIYRRARACGYENLTQIFAKFKLVRNKVKYMIRIAKKNHFNEKFATCGDSSKFWKLVSPFLPSRRLSVVDGQVIWPDINFVSICTT